jgi:superoxide reductase
MIKNWIFQWVELVTEEGTLIQRKFLSPSDTPKAAFKTEADKVVAREYYNLHRLWKA